jgi:hypothetical protein
LANNEIMACAICEVRRDKRFCPAIHGRICPLCCGEQREVTLDCPRDCPYLQQAREHEKPRSLEDVDQAALFPEVEISEPFLYEFEPLILGLHFALAKSVQRDRILRDADLIAALTSEARRYETLLRSGLHYENPPSLANQQAIVAELQELIKGYRETEQRNAGYSRLRDSDTLRALVFMVRLGYARTSGRPKSRAYIDFVVAQFPEKSAIAAPESPGSRIVVP